MRPLQAISRVRGTGIAEEAHYVLHTTAGFYRALETTVLYSTLLYYTVLYCTVLYCTVLYCTVLYCTVMYCTVLYCAAWIYNISTFTSLHYMPLYCTLRHCTVLHFIRTRRGTYGQIYPFALLRKIYFILLWGKRSYKTCSFLKIKVTFIVLY